MNLLLLAGFAVGCLTLLWTAQTAALALVAAPRIFCLPYRHGSSSLLVRWIMKAALHAGLLSVLIGYPWAIGCNPWEYHRAHFGPLAWPPLVIGAGLALAMLSVPLLFALSAGWIELTCHYGTGKLLYKLSKSLLIPIPLTLVEEPLFRGIVQEQLLDALPTATGLAIVLSSLLFASVHFIRPHTSKLLPALGLFSLGVVLSLAFVRTGRHYLMPIAIHAAGVWFIQATRPLTAYRGPAWLIGYSTYPICGAMGLTAMALLGAIIGTAVG